MAGVPGLEPGNAGVKVLCLTDLATPQNMAEPTRFELAIFGVTGRRVNQTTPRLRIGAEEGT